MAVTVDSSDSFSRCIEVGLNCLRSFIMFIFWIVSWAEAISIFSILMDVCSFAKSLNICEMFTWWCSERSFASISIMSVKSGREVLSSRSFSSSGGIGDVILSFDVYKTQSDLKARSVYPSRIFVVFGNTFDPHK